jgi:hypothetical protein
MPDLHGARRRASTRHVARLWYAKRYFGLEVRGDLVVQRRDRWQASIPQRILPAIDK